MLSSLDRVRLHEALALAERTIGLSDLNPCVGCVIGHDDGRILGRGFTQEAGGPHAEIMALRDALAAGHDARGATAWVTLEPCAHHGRTPPCCDALIAAGLARVVVAIGDPFAQVAGAGLARLRAAGVEVALADAAADADITGAAREINIGFFSRIERARPWVRAKIAMSLDGRTALANGSSQWITGQAARRDGHHWRRRAGAIVTGIGTVLADDPRLDARFHPTTYAPLRVIVDGRLRTPVGARILQPPGKAMIVAAVDDDARRRELEAAGAVLSIHPGDDGSVDLSAMIGAMSTSDINEVHVEAGARLTGSLLRLGLVDELLVYIAPVLLGDGPGPAEIGPIARLADALRFVFVDRTAIDEDLRLRLRPIGAG